MQNRYIFMLIASLLILDTIFISGTISFVSFYTEGKSYQIVYDFNHMIITNLSWLAASILTGLYRYTSVQTIKNIGLKSLQTFLLQILIIFVLINFSDVLYGSGNDFILILTIELIILFVIRICIKFSEKYFFNFEPYKKKIAIVGKNDISLKLEQYFLKNKLSFVYSGSFKTIESIHDNDNTLKNLKNDIIFAIENHLDEVYTTIFPHNNSSLTKLLKIAEQNCVRVKFITSFLEFHNQDSEFVNSKYKLANYYDGIPILVARVEPLSFVWNRIIKRAFDILFSLAVIIFLLTWLMPILMIIIRLESPGPTIFTQLRSGRNNQPFYCLKFRSMRLNALSNEKQATKGDARITKLGAFMRRTSIDELPQFFNVLVGNMSVVGPRPHMLKHTEEYRQIIDQYMVRHYLKPGITGWAQINGHRGETKEHYQMLNRVEHDVWYMENWSLSKDLEIIYKTLANAAKGEENAF